MSQNQHEAAHSLRIDGKDVRKYLFARYSRVMVPGCIPVDRKEKARVLNATDQPRFLVQVQVEAFTVDHALERLQNELYPMIARKDWELIAELDPEHDIGIMGAKHPLSAAIMAPGSRRRQ